MKKLPIGRSDFKKIITQNYCYVDKTLFIKDIIDKGDDILLVPRPRRFGKTLNLSMLKYFYDCCPEKVEKGKDSSDSHKKLFDSLAISKAGKEYLDKMGKHPVIFISFRDAKEMEWETCMNKVRQIIQDKYLKHDYLLDSPKLKPQEKDYFNRVINLKGNRGDYEKSLEKLLVFLNRFYNARAVILIDEYDAPVYAGFNHGYYDEIINFMRNFLCGGLLIWISNTHEIKSNRESGYGRYDISIIPQDINQFGYVMEFKTVDKEDNETVEIAAAAALAQIEEKKYETELIDQGIENIKKLAVVFSGKDVYVKEK